MATKEYFPGIGKIKFDERMVEIRYGMVAHIVR